LIICLALLLAATSSFAGRPDKSWKNWFGHVSGGYSMPQGDFADVVDDDWTFAGGATYWPETWPVGIDIELAYNDWDVTSEALREFNEQQPPGGNTLTGGGVDIWSLTADFIWSPGRGRVSPYIMGGLGVYRLRGRLTSTGLVFVPPTCDPWWGWCRPGGWVPGQIVEQSVSSTDIGYNVAIGLNFEMSSGSQMFLEAKYHYEDSDPLETTFLPIVIGYRW
jgi:opacity protein-like surface antigen